MNWIGQLLSRRRLDRDLSDEIREHIEEHAAELAAGGMPRDEALEAARRAFGNATLIEETGREVWRWAAIESLFADFRYAARQLRRAPAFTLASILTVALGVGANTAAFSVVNAVILRPLPFAQPDRLVSVESCDIRGGPHPSDLSYPTFFDFRAQNRVLEHLVCYRDDSFTLSSGGQALHLPSQIVSWGLFPMLGVVPVLGRGFLPAEEQPDQRVVVVSHELWRDRLGADPAIVGRTLPLDGESFTVVGVAPAGFNFPVRARRVQLWTTLARDARSTTVQPVTAQRGNRMLGAIARLRPTVSLEQARAQLDTVAAALARQYPDHNQNVPSTYVKPELERLLGDNREVILVLWGAVALVLLIACANTANLLLARTAEREREFAMRLAIGASRGRVVRQLLTENLLFALAGSAAGVGLAAVFVQLVLPYAGNSIPRIEQSGIDARALAFTITLAFITTLLFSISPAVRILRFDFDGTVRHGSRGTTDANDRMRSGLVVVQVALGLVLLSSAAVLGAAFLHFARRDPGFRSDHLLAFSVGVPSASYDEPKQIAFGARLLEELRALPGVVSAAAGTPLPLEGAEMTITFDIQGRPRSPSARQSSSISIVTPGFFETMGIPLLAGRDFTERDDHEAPGVFVVNQAFADRFFPGENALGKRIESGVTSRRGPRGMREIVGIVGNARQDPLGARPEPIYYFPYRQLPWFLPTVIVRTLLPPLGLEPAVRSVVASLDKEVTVHHVGSLDQTQFAGVAQPRFLTILLGSFAAIALLLTSVGLYGVLTYSVLRRTREIGIRMALGATRSAILTMILRRAMTMVALGGAIGLAGALAGHRLLRAMLHGAESPLPPLIAAACTTMVLTASAAAYLPARRAASMHPVDALRVE